jgi:hypothetical protein
VKAYLIGAVLIIIPAILVKRLPVPEKGES